MTVKERPLKLVIFEASLELVPRELARHPSVYKPAWRRGKKPEETLLDASLHHQAIRSKGLEDASKRGRPDIVHVILLEATSNPLIEHGVMDVYVHTIADYVLEIRPGTRLPRNYNRFVGLIEQLLTVGQVPPESEEPLITARPLTLSSLLRMLKPEVAILYAWESGGEKRRVREISTQIAELTRKGRRIALLLPGYPQGAPSARSIHALKGLPAARLYEPIARLEAWTLVSATLSLIADALGLL